jgi:mannose-6-phosphate isomerase-like protein (cupin superfamily)
MDDATATRTPGAHAACVQPLAMLATYAPPGHSGVRNWRLVDRAQTLGFEMALGEAEPGGDAEPHVHDVATQVMFILEGHMELRLGDDAPVLVGPQTLVTIPPGLPHALRNPGPGRLLGLVLYSPPLPAA